METELILVFVGLYGLVIFLLFKTFNIDGKLRKLCTTEKYEPSITFWKFVKQLVFGAASYLVVETIGKYLISLHSLDSFLMIFLIAVFNAVNHYVKFR